MSEYEFVGGENGGDEDRVTEWEVGLLSIDDLMPLSQLLIPPELASALVFHPKLTGPPWKSTAHHTQQVEEADSALRNNENDKLSMAAKISDSQTWWISAAMIDQEMCLDGLGREESSSGLERQKECE
ncbi:transcription factor BOA-like [Quercus lobata]|uniref:transcription factor BOA-like n=1 Tax=Quercus lobata TaxID=97700 RepID=UPI00124564D3|nr:transcription factor BOA-like [Quercus lobata]